MLDVTTIVLTFNEAIHIERVIENAKKVSKRVVVVDSFSKDETTNLARKLGAEVYFNEFKNQAQQFSWAVENCSINTEWVLRLDADEYLEDSLVDEIIDKLPGMSNEVNGVLFKRKHFFLGRWIRFGGRFPLIMLRLFRTGTGHVEQRWMDEHIVIDSGLTVLFESCFVDDNKNSIDWFVEKHNRYASREAFDLLSKDFCLNNICSDSDKLNFRSRVVRALKERLYNLMPIFVRPLLYFVYRYIFLFGFLDGKSGLVYHFLQGFWYRFLVDAKVFEFSLLTKAMSKEHKFDFLKRYTGCR